MRGRRWTQNEDRQGLAWLDSGEKTIEQVAAALARSVSSVRNHFQGRYGFEKHVPQVEQPNTITKQPGRPDWSYPSPELIALAHMCRDEMQAEMAIFRDRRNA